MVLLSEVPIIDVEPGKIIFPGNVKLPVSPNLQVDVPATIKVLLSKLLDNEEILPITKLPPILKLPVTTILEARILPPYVASPPKPVVIPDNNAPLPTKKLATTLLAKILPETVILAILAVVTPVITLAFV